MRCTKIRKIDNHLLFAVNDFDCAMELYAWWERGADPVNWPAFQSDKDSWSPLGVIKPDKTIWRYERRAYPLRIDEPYFACGSGRDFAIAAMFLGRNAREAVEVACNFEASCGLGVDVLTLD